jgi:hypothetical protein
VNYLFYKAEIFTISSRTRREVEELVNNIIEKVELKTQNNYNFTNRN